MTAIMLRLALTILWPAFLVAGMADGLFFSLIDPEELLHLIGQPDMPPMAAYTVGFFFFWMFTALTGLLTYYLIKVPSDDSPSI